MDQIFARIILKNRFKENFLSKFACTSISSIRLDPSLEETQDRKSLRPSFSRDVDRIIYTQAYTRYIDKTQVFYLFEHDHITHRVLHVQFVSKIARTIGRFLGLNEDLIEAIALGHDIGHSPFGHDGERILNKICERKKIGSFVHSAQSVKQLMEIEKRYNGKPLNLSLQVLDGILCHNGENPISKDGILKPKFKTWDIFMSEYSSCFKDYNHVKKLSPMTLEGCVVRISDVIAYIGRDIEDAITINLFTRENLIKKLPEFAINLLGSCNHDMINSLIMDIVKKSYGQEYVRLSEDVCNAMRCLQEFSIKYIYNDERIRSQNNKIKHIFLYMFNKYKKDFRSKRVSKFEEWYELLDNEYKLRNSLSRSIIDYISGMTDDFLSNEFVKYTKLESYGYKLNIEENKE